MQTAVEWLVEMIYSPACNGFLNGNRKVIPHDIIEEAKKKEKQQIVDAVTHCWETHDSKGYVPSGEEYYNQTFKK